MTSGCNTLCPLRMSSRDVQQRCDPACAWYTADGCAVRVLVAHMVDSNLGGDVIHVADAVRDTVCDVADAVRDTAREVQSLRDDIYRLNSK